MLGYSSQQSSLDAYNHDKELKKKVPDKFKKEIDCVYNWIKTREFTAAIDYNTKESWEWLRSSMMNPPLKVIQKYSELSTNHVCLQAAVLEKRIIETPKCRLCKKTLAKTIVEKCKFSIIICTCDKSWCHVSCADNHVLKHPKCNICKEYFILSPYYASIQSRIANHDY